MNEEKSIFDFDTIKEFSGLITREPFDDEAMFIAILDSQINEILEQEPKGKSIFLSVEEIEAIQNNEALLYEIKKQTKVYEFSKLDIKLFVRNMISITTDQENRYLLNFPIRRYMTKGREEIALLDEHDNSFII
ncbi:hypothetical protein [Pedobacter sp. CG_S7]|uniref:hypothetical protein n=1 Tax=Pedobacter sp. CG_S7 TaxID=3143930 RepID=UPI00339968D0